MIIIAEIGTAHGGSIEKAKELIDAASQAGADAVKFQWVYADEILHPDTGFVTLPGGAVRLYDRFRALEVDADFFADCMAYARHAGLLFACSPFGLRSLRELARLRPDAIKIASPELNHIHLLKEAARYYVDIPLILSSGVSRLGDIEDALSLFDTSSVDEHVRSGGQNRQDTRLPPLSLLHCITCYPAPEQEYNIRCVDTLRRVFGVPTGISDHSLDPVLVPVLTAMVGGSLIEKHITLSRQTDGLDDPVALEPQQFAQMVHAVHQAEALMRRYQNDALATSNMERESLSTYEDGLLLTAAQAEIMRQLRDEYGSERVYTTLGSGVKRLAPSETANYGRTNRSLHFVHAMHKGEVIHDGDIAVLRTEKVLSPGISPRYLATVTGARVQKDVPAGAGVQWQDVMDSPCE